MVPPRLDARPEIKSSNTARCCPLESRPSSGYPAEVIVAIWGLETDFGAGNGNFQTIRSLASLAYDCRRPDKFRGELLAALKIVDRGDMSPADMHGAWARVIGQTQFLPSSYLKFAVDYDGDGCCDLIHSVPDVLASTANYLKGYGSDSPTSRGAKAQRTSRCCCNGTRHRSTPRLSLFLPNSSPAGDDAQ